VNDLSEGCGVLEFSGPDAVRFLNGQVTQDVRMVKEGGGLLSSCVTDAKGKLMHRVWLGRRGDTVLVFCREDNKEAVEARLTKYLIADDVEVRDVSGHVEGNDFIFPEEWTDELERVERGIPKWGTELKEGMLLHEAGLEDSDVSFHKGCYVGQEVVSRVESAGKVNRRMVKLQFFGEGKLGDLYDDNGRVCGEVTSVAGGIGLGFIKRVAEGNRFVSENGMEVLVIS